MKFKGVTLATCIVLALCGCSSHEPTSTMVVQAAQKNARVTFQAIVSQQPIDTQLPVYASINQALDALAEQNLPPIVMVLAGEYYERVVINRDNTKIIGVGKKTKIVFDRYAGQAVAEGSDETWGTFRTATVEINATNVALANLTVENSFDFLTNDGRDDNDPAKVSGSQAVALKIAESANKTVLDSVYLKGFQDTLYAQGGMSYITDSEIWGNVDFIFGNGNVVIENSRIISRPRAAEHKYSGYVTAPSTLIQEDWGFTFLKCEFERTPGVPDNSVPLGRPWHPTTQFTDGRYANPDAIGKTTIIESFLDAHIANVGWASMGGTKKEGGKKQFHPLSDARFEEYGNTGPGAVISSLRPQLSDDDRMLYTKEQIFDGWTPVSPVR